MKLAPIRTLAGRAAPLEAALALCLATIGAGTAAATTGFEGTATTYLSPNGLKEQCLALSRMPGGVYSEADRASEQAFCGIDFYDGSHALCPKVFSTSPGTLVYDISRGPFAGKADAFEAEQCATGSPVKRGAVGEPVSFKTTMNDSHTSATFATASLLYYHFSRYLDAEVHVPVSVYRSMDKAAHLERVTRRGVALSAQRKGGAMNHAGWLAMEAAQQRPSAYAATDELFTPDRQQIFGVLLHPQGDRYSAEFNGTRRSGWGEGQNRDFQDTAPFQALRAEQPLLKAIEHGIHQASADPALRQAMRHGVSPEQMVFWMQELTEITLLDYIFSQQDRVGNIDYIPYWHWADHGKVKRQRAEGTHPPATIAGAKPLLIKRTWLNDNDAGGKRKYANFTKKTGMLEKVRHYNPETYRRLMALDKDFKGKGKLYAYVRDTFGLTDDQLGQVVTNTHQAADILRGSCQAGKLRFDLDPDGLLATGKPAATKIDCANP